MDSAKAYLIEQGLLGVVEAYGEVTLGPNQKLAPRAEPYPPNLIDLQRLHRFIISRKRTTIMEFGVGWSTLVFCDALSKLKLKFSDEFNRLRRSNPFELHALDNEAKYIEIAEARLPEKLKQHAYFYQSEVQMGTFNNRICTYYKRLPHVSPDFIYVDGPGQFNVQSDISGWSTRHKDMMPMSADILRIEHFLTPGTIIVFDGRAANARFFRSNIQRNWDYKYEEEYDQHVFELSEEPLGKFNKMQMNFYSSV